MQENGALENPNHSSYYISPAKLQIEIKNEQQNYAMPSQYETREPNKIPETLQEFKNIDGVEEDKDKQAVPRTKRQAAKHMAKVEEPIIVDHSCCYISSYCCPLGCLNYFNTCRCYCSYFQYRACMQCTDMCIKCCAQGACFDCCRNCGDCHCHRCSCPDCHGCNCPDCHGCNCGDCFKICEGCSCRDCAACECLLKGCGECLCKCGPECIGELCRCLGSCNCGDFCGQICKAFLCICQVCLKCF